MSNSLRDQLKGLGFKEPPTPAPKPAPVSRLVLDPVVIPVAASLPGAGVSGAASGVQPDLVTSQAGTDLDLLQVQMAQDRQEQARAWWSPPDRRAR